MQPSHRGKELLHQLQPAHGQKRVDPRFGGKGEQGFEFRLQPGTARLKRNRLKTPSHRAAMTEWTPVIAGGEIVRAFWVDHSIVEMIGTFSRNDDVVVGLDTQKKGMDFADIVLKEDTTLYVRTTATHDGEQFLPGADAGKVFAISRQPIPTKPPARKFSAKSPPPERTHQRLVTAGPPRRGRAGGRRSWRWRRQHKPGTGARHALSLP